jgi:tryptophan synthase alpha chain
MSRLEPVLRARNGAGGAALVAYVTAGDPDLARSADIVVAVDRAGAAAIEIGVPFSDPVADGPVIQRAAERALAAGTTLGGVLDLVSRVRPRVTAPLVLFSYLNPILRLGARQFAVRAAGAGLDGVLVLDLPAEEAGEMRDELLAAGLDMVFLVAPTTTDERLARAATLAGGFIYAISRLGVTGARRSVADGARDLVARVRAVSGLPVAVGFGLSHPDHVRDVCQWADAAVVGSSLVNVVAGHTADPRLPDRVAAHVRWLLGRGES